MRHITIEHFGPIKKIDIDLNKKLEVVIGPQASGKSTFIKVVYFCRKIRDYFLQYLSGVINTELNYTDELYTNFLKYIRRPFMGYFGTTKHMGDFFIRYYYDKETDRYVSINLDKDRYAKFNLQQIIIKCPFLSVFWRKIISLSVPKKRLSKFLWMTSCSYISPLVGICLQFCRME